MRSLATQPFAALSVLLLLQSGCSLVRGGPGAENTPIVVEELIKTSRSWDGELLPAYPEGRPEITIRKFSIPPGARLEAHLHPVINAGVLISGQLTVKTLEGKTLHLNAGDPIVELVNTFHFGVNPGKVPAEIIVVYAGTADTPITVIKPQ